MITHVLFILEYKKWSAQLWCSHVFSYLALYNLIIYQGWVQVPLYTNRPGVFNSPDLPGAVSVLRPYPELF